MRISKISTPGKRKKLDPRPGPYFEQISKNVHIGFRKNQTGGRWVAKFERKVHTLGDESQYTYEEAKAEAVKWAKSLEGLTDKDYSIENSLDDYQKHLTAAKSYETAKTTVSRVRNKLPEKLLKTPLRSLKKADLKHWRDSLVKTGDPETVRKSRDTANRILSNLKAALNLAYKLDKCTSRKPWEIEAFRGVTAARTVFLTQDEIGRLIKVTADDPFFNALIRAAILTGARYGELCNVKKQDYDPDDGSLKLSGKTGTRFSTLSTKAIEFFKKQSRLKKPDSFLLPRDDTGTPWGKSHQKRRIDKAVKVAGLPKGTVFYSLRHFHASRALAAGMPPLDVAHNLGTSVKMLEKNYAKYMKAERRSFLDSSDISEAL